MTVEEKERLLDRIRTNPYVMHMQIQFDVVEKGYVEARIPLFPEQKQYSGVIHGGVLAAIADTVAGFVTYTMTPLTKDVLTAELNVMFLRAAWGDELVAKAKMIKPGRSVHFSECEIYCQDKMVCKATGTFSVVEPQV